MQHHAGAALAGVSAAELLSMTEEQLRRRLASWGARTKLLKAIRANAASAAVAVVVTCDQFCFLKSIAS